MNKEFLKRNAPSIPVYMGEPFYNVGTPVRPEHHTANGKTMQELFILYLDMSATPLQIKTLKEYVIYFLHAPCWGKGEPLQRMLAQELSKYTLDDILTVAEFIGISIPFINI